MKTCDTILVLAALPLVSSCVSQARLDSLERANRSLEMRLAGESARVQALEENNGRLRGHLEVARHAQRLAASWGPQLSRQLEEERKRTVDLTAQVARWRAADRRLAARLARREAELAERRRAARIAAGLEAGLRGLAARHGVVYEPGSGRLRIGAAVLFGPTIATPSASGRALLAELARLLARTGHSVEVEGHTDADPVRAGTDGLWRFGNWGLSARRALEVLARLEKGGVAARRLFLTARSMYRPVADNGSRRGKAANRRVEIVLHPPGPARKVPAPQ